MLLAAALVLELARESLTGSHCRYREYVNDLPTDHYVTMPCGGVVAAPATMTTAAEAAAPPLRWLDGRVVRREVRDGWQHDYDATTGALVQSIPLFYRAKPARVFDPNPVVTLNDPNLQDLNDQAAHIPASAYRDVQLDDDALRGRWVTIVDPPEGSLVLDREDDGFEDVNAYFHIDRNHSYLQSLGYSGARTIAPYAVPVHANANKDDNSFFVPSSTQLGRGTLFYGEGGTDDAEDADIVVHEYAHALHEWIAPATFAGSFGSEARAFSEAFADYWAFSAHYDARRASGRDPFCFADWDARCWLDASTERCAYPPGSDCLRRLDSTLTMADYLRTDSSGVEHRNGSIFSSALREIRTKIVGRAPLDLIVLESMFGAPPRPTFATMALRILQADRLLNHGEHQTVICDAFRARGILAACDLAPRGELTHFASTQSGLAIPDNDPNGITSTLTIDDPRAIEAIYVRVDVEHPANGDLRVELIAPDGTTLLLQAVSTAGGSGLHETYGRTIAPAQSLDVLRGRSAAGTWTLRVADQHPRDVGRLQSWGLDIQFAGDAPRTTRPREGRSQMIPAVTHILGGAGDWKSDVHIANPGPSPVTATLIFTRSRDNGLERFSAMRIALRAGQTVVLRDVVDRVFHTAGSGSLEVLGDVVVGSRTYTRLGQEIPPVRDTTVAGGAPLFVAGLNEAASYQLGITETSGGRGVVRFGLQSAVTIEPFSHVQFQGGPELQQVSVVSGDARIAAYLSQLSRGDAMFIPAQTPRIGIAPVITEQTSETPQWRSDLWIATQTPSRVRVDAIPGGSVEAEAPAVYEDVLARLFHRTVTMAALRVHVPQNAFAATRIVHGGTTQLVPLLDAGPAEQHVVFAGEGRTNAGIVAAEGATAEVIVYDAAGVETQRFLLSTSGGYAQRSVTGRRAVVRFLLGSGRAYASTIDPQTGDAAFLAGQ